MARAKSDQKPEMRAQSPHAQTGGIPRRRRGFEAASAVVLDNLRQPFEQRGFAEARLLTRWPEIMGAELSALARPLEIRFDRGLGGTLVVLATGSQAPIVEMRKGEMLDRVNACYGYRAVARIRITQTAAQGFAEAQTAFAAPKAPEPQPDRVALAAANEALTHITTPELQSALGRLARRVLTQ